MPVLLLLLLSLVGCASQRDRVIAAEAWTSELRRDHPLVGKVWQVGAREFASMQTLENAVAGANLVVLGEVHDNPDHHQVQARLVRAAARGKSPVLAFEMIDANLQRKVDAAGSAPDAVARAIEWDKSGWPAFSIYRPIFEAAEEARLPIVAANLPRAEARAVVMKGLTSLAPELKAEVEKRWPPPASVIDVRREEMKAAHCGHFAKAMLEPMVLAQLSRDVHLARRLLETAERDGGLLIAGNGHARTDWGVPSILTSEAPERKVLSVGILEVEPDASRPEDYAVRWGGALPFDFVVFTPAAAREDPCEALKKPPHE